jgi:hypothetical protein
MAARRGQRALLVAVSAVAIPLQVSSAGASPARSSSQVEHALLSARYLTEDVREE